MKGFKVEFECFLNLMHLSQRSSLIARISCWYECGHLSVLRRWLSQTLIIRQNRIACKGKTPQQVGITSHQKGQGGTGWYSRSAQEGRQSSNRYSKPEHNSTSGRWRSRTSPLPISLLTGQNSRWYKSLIALLMLRLYKTDNKSSKNKGLKSLKETVPTTNSLEDWAVKIYKLLWGFSLYRFTIL